MAVGNDGNGGGAEGAGNAWKTIDKAMNTVAADDKVWVKASANYTEIATIDTAGGNRTPIIFEGYTTATGDGGRAVIDGGGARANCVVDSLGDGVNGYYVFKNFRMTNATGIGFSTQCNQLVFKNCKFDTHGSTGLQCYSVLCEDCDFESNTGTGANILGAAGTAGGIFVGCTFYSNSANGVTSNSHPLAVIHCTFFSNADNGIHGIGDNMPNVVVNCTVDGDSKDTSKGVAFNSDDCLIAVVNTVVYDTAEGLVNDGGNMKERMISRNNCLNANTADYSNMDTFTGEVTAAPNFVNEVGGADYTPDTGSPLIGAGFDVGSNMDIGGVQKAAGAGGGGLLMPNKRAGKQ